MRYSLCVGASIETVNGTCMLITAQGDIAVLNKTGCYVITQILEGSNLEEAVLAMVKAYDVELDKTNKEILKLIAYLEKKHFICICE